MTPILSTLMIIFSVTAPSFDPDASRQDPRCIVGVIDRIEHPLVVIATEDGSTLTVHSSRSDHPLREGQWVIYWTHFNRIEPLISSIKREEELYLMKKFDQLSTPLPPSSRL